MRRKQVWRYYCEHCSKGGCSAPHMTRHERGCTKNPNRVCGVCLKAGLDPHPPLAELVSFIRSKSSAGPHFSGDPDDSMWFAKKDAIDALRELASNCPVCMLAALRQAGVYPESSVQFDFRAELKSIWSDVNSEREYYV